MRRSPRTGLVGVIVAALLLTGLRSPCSAQSLDRQVDAIVSQAKLGPSKIGVCIVDVRSGEQLAASGESTRLIPASNMKLLTSGAALLTLGHDFEFRTKIVQRGRRLVIVGAGDPAFADPTLLASMKLTVREFVEQIATSVREAGAGPIEEIVVDDRVFDREYIHPDWPKDQLNDWYCAEVSGLNFHVNTVHFFATPAGGNDPPRLTIEPSVPSFEIRNKARVNRKSKTQLGVDRLPDANVFTVSGTLAGALEAPIRVNAHQPSLIFAEALAQRISGENPPRCRLAGPEENLGILETDKVLSAVRTPIAIVLERCNADSYNLYAEALAKAAGHAVTGQPGSWENGAAVVRAYLRDEISPEAASQVFIADGSGMSRNDQVTASVLARWLAMMANKPDAGPVFVESLASVGEGTLEERFRSHRPKCEIRGKSGFINGVRTLSGYVTERETGRRAAFSILVNDTPGSVGGARVREFHEQVVMALDAWLSKSVAAEVRREAIGG